MKKHLLIFIVVFAVFLSLASCSDGNKNDSEKNSENTSGNSSKGETGAEVSPDPLLGQFTTTDLDGNTVTESVIGECELTMINIWGTFCGPCLNEMPDLGEISREYAERGFQIIGIVCDVEDRYGEIDQSMVDYAKELVSETNADYLHIVPCDELNTARLNDVVYIPETFFLDKHGNIVGEPITGSQTKDKWIKIIEEKLTEISGER